jgi:hypothetical protein
MTLLPESGNEVQSQWLTGCTACTHDKSDLSGIFATQICET